MRTAVRTVLSFLAIFHVAINYQLAMAASESFYTRPALFSTRPKAEYAFTQSVDRFGPVGIGIELTQPAFGMKIKNVEPGSPAAASGKLKAGQIIETINGERLKDIDPRIQLGRIITAAEASDGKVTFVVRDTPEEESQTITVSIPVLGAYSETWPLNCPKSDKIVRDLAARFKAEGYSGGIGLDGPKILFLLSTGEAEDLAVVREWMKRLVEKNQNYGSGMPYQWHIAWGAPPIAEYYLRTGDASVLPLMQRIADAVKKTQYQGGWGGRGMAGHHMGLAGTGTLTFLLLAKQCGVDVDDVMLQSALEHYFRFAGRGTNPYMDHPPESTFTDNGRNGRLAFAMAAASRLHPDGEASLYAKARDINAIKSFYSTSYMLHGHTGGGIGEVWRSAAMGLMVEKKPEHYREFMDTRTWFYDLSRRYDGSFGIIGGGKRYDKTDWGIAMGLTYTAPRKQLCIFGAPRSQYAKVNDAVPDRPWGTAADDAFLSLEAPAMPDGTVRKLEQETVADDTGLHVDHKMRNPDLSDDERLKYLYHPEHRLREVAALDVKKHKRLHVIPRLLNDSDPRVRHAGVVACDPSFFAADKPLPGFLRDAVKARILEMLNDPNEAWFTTYELLKLAGGLPVETLVPHVDRLTGLLGHQEWWLRHKALEALIPLALDSRTYRKVLPAIEMNWPNFIRSNWQVVKRLEAAGNAPPEVQQAVRETLGRVYLAYPGPKAVDPPGGVYHLAEKNVLRTLAYAFEKVPGGLEVLFDVSTKRYPNQSLPHREQFLSDARGTLQNEKIKKAIQAIVAKELIPKKVAKDWKKLKAFAAGESGHASVMQELQNLYAQAGVEEYDWAPYGPSRDEMEWDYYSFDPPEEWAGVSDRLGRYRDVTFPEGMANWFSGDFEPDQHGWKRGLAPFGSADGKKGYISGATSPCGLSICGCGEPIHTLWEKDVILLRGTFKVPPMEEGYCYRLLHGGISHVGSGDGYRLYINGKLFFEDKTGVDRRGGGRAEGKVITKEWWPEFESGKVTLAAISFMKHHPRTKKYGGNISVFMERMKVPPLTTESLETAAAATPLLTSEWQALQDPDRVIDDPDEGKFAWDGTFVSNADIVGTWQAVAQVSSVQAFDPTKKKSVGRVPFKTLVLKEDGKTADAQWIWSGDMLMDLDKGQALQMTTEKVDDMDYLFVETGGFSAKHPVGWECTLVVMKRGKQR